MAFEAKRTTNQDEGGSNVDYKALNRYLVETADLEEEGTVIGIISGVVDLGEQKQEDAKVEWKGTAEEEQVEIDKFSDTYFETDPEDGKRYKRWPQKPVQAVAITVDLPDVVVDKAQFYEEGTSNPAPMRLCLNGTFWRKELKVMDLGKIFPLTLRKNAKTNDHWSLLPTNTLYKMAVGAKVIKAGEPFTPEMLTELLGKALLFKVMIYFNGDFYNERISYAAGLMKGQEPPEYDENLLFSVGFDSDNTDKEITYLTKPMINRMKMSTEWEGSKVKEQIDEVKNYAKTDEEENTSAQGPAPDDFDPDSVPF